MHNPTTTDALDADLSATEPENESQHPQRRRFQFYWRLPSLKIRVPIAYKLALAITLLITVGMSLLGLIVVGNQTQLMSGQILNYGETVVQQLADSATEPVLADDKLSLSAMMNNIAGNVGIYGAAIYSDQNELLEKTGLIPAESIGIIYNQSNELERGGIHAYDWRATGSQVVASELVSFIAPINFKELTAGHVLVTLSRSHITSAISDSINIMIAVTILLNLLTIVAAFFMSKRISRPIHKLLEATTAIADGNYDYRITDKRRDEIGELITGFNGMAAGLAEKHKVETVLSRYVSRDVASEALENIDQVKLGGENVNATVLFADIVGFTKISEKLAPAEIAELLNEYFTYIAQISEMCHGTIDKFMGDCTMVVFGVLRDDPDHRFHAIACAVMIKRLMDKLNVVRMRQNKPAIFFRIGINSGDMLAGNLGSRDRLHYTVVGDAVNLAARLAEQAGGGQILIAEEFYLHNDIQPRIQARRHKTLDVRGKQDSIDTYLVNEVTAKYRDALNVGLEQILGYRAA